MKKIVITSIVLIAIFSLISWKLMANKQEIDSRKEVKTTNTDIAVTVTKAEMENVSTNMSLTGTTEAKQFVKIPSKGEGQIIEINFKLGDYVSKGTVLARVDDTYSKLALDNAKINYNKCKDDVQRYEALREGDAVSETQLRDMKINLDNAKIQLDQAQRKLDDTYIRAPFGGYITSKDIDLGKYVKMSDPIAEIADISELKVVLSVSESNVYNLRVGQEVAVTTQIYPNVKFTGKISNISPQGDSSHTYPVEISLANSKEHQLKAGTYVDVAIGGGSDKTRAALLIPRDAIINTVKDPSVYLVENNTVKMVKITTGKDYESKIEVIQGLQKGDQIVVNGQINLMDGAQVVIN